jgi:hypothetical protein
MRIRSFVFPTSALALGAVLLTPTESVGWSTIGGKLATETQRDVRVFNNFTDPQANNNTGVDNNWPGYDGAELAIWKGCTEWSSEKHNNNGNGDPSQNGGLGGSGANFDITWQGNATAIGNTNQNVHSEISGTAGGTLAFTESPISDGWRIRYYREPWTWNDGPNTVVTGGNAVDLQGVACHEYGHAIGLGHSGSFQATMYPSIIGNGVGTRSTNGDDRSGVQFIYLTLDLAKKAHVSSYSQSNGILSITGTLFSLTPGANEVWFTQAGTGGSGEAVKVTGLTSTAGGTQLSCVIPVAAGPGDFVVRNQDITGPKGMSNQIAIIPEAVSCGAVTNYCTPGTSAAGCNAIMSASGTPSATAASGFNVIATGVEGAKDGLFFYGTNGQQANSWGSGTSFQCIIPPVLRAGLLTGVGTAGVCNGTFSQDFNALWTSNPAKNPGNGAVVDCQLWYRDPFSTSNQTTSLSDGISFSVCP